MIETLLVDYLIGGEDPNSGNRILARIRLPDVFGYSSVLLEPQISSPLASLTEVRSEIDFQKLIALITNFHQYGSQLQS